MVFLADLNLTFSLTSSSGWLAPIRARLRLVGFWSRLETAANQGPACQRTLLTLMLTSSSSSCAAFFMDSMQINWEELNLFFFLFFHCVLFLLNNFDASDQRRYSIVTKAFPFCCNFYFEQWFPEMDFWIWSSSAQGKNRPAISVTLKKAGEKTCAISKNVFDTFPDASPIFEVWTKKLC